MRSLVESRMMYGVEIWVVFSRHLEAIEQVQLCRLSKCSLKSQGITVA